MTAKQAQTLHALAIGFITGALTFFTEAASNPDMLSGKGALKHFLIGCIVAGGAKVAGLIVAKLPTDPTNPPTSS